MMDPELEEIALLRKTAREYGIAEDEVLRAWEEVQREWRLPFYVWPLLEPGRDGREVVLSPAVDIKLLGRLDRELPGWEYIPRPTWPNKRFRGSVEAARLKPQTILECAGECRECPHHPCPCRGVV